MITKFHAVLSLTDHMVPLILTIFFLDISKSNKISAVCFDLCGPCPSGLELRDIFVSKKVNKTFTLYFHIYYCMYLELIPCISLASEDPLHEGLWWHPFDWQHCTATLPVVAGSGAKN